MQKFKGELMLLFATIMWGSGFIFQKMGMDHLGPFTFMFFRFGAAALLLYVFTLVMDWFKRKKGVETTSFVNKTMLWGGFVIGTVNFIASALQQTSLIYLDAGKDGFITAMYLFFTPLILLFVGRKVHIITWCGIFLAFVGMYLLCMTGDFYFQMGDIICLGGSCGYAFQIIAIDRYAQKCDPVKLTIYELAFTALWAIVLALIFEDIQMVHIINCTIPILYTAIFETGIAFTLQIVGQRYASPAIAALIMSFESVFAALCGALFLGEVLTPREFAGCVIMFIAIIIAQIPEFRGNENK